MEPVTSNGRIFSPNRHPLRSLPIEQWPPADRDAWALACRPSHRLIRGGAGAHMKPITLADLARRYGYFLDFLDGSGLLDRHAMAAGQVTPANVAAYLDELRSRVSSVTTYGSIYKLRRASQLLDKDRDFGWLAEYEKDLALLMQPRSKADRWVLTEVLVECGLTLMTEAEQSTKLSRLRKARQFRDGFMVAMLALHPIRLKNFANLQIGRDFLEINGQWWITLPSAATKEGRPDERRIDRIIASALEGYLSTHRSALMKQEKPTNALWLSSNSGGPMTYHAVAAAIERTTRRSIGIGLNPHMFRTAAASTAAIHSGDKPNLATALLHHCDERTAERHYNLASSLSAATAFGEVIKNEIS